MSKAALALWVAAAFAGGELLYHAGRNSVVRECPDAQHGDRLLYSEQRATGTVCTYAAAWKGHGRTLARKTP